MSSDHLSDVLDLVQVRTTLSGAFAVDSRWTSRADLCDQLKVIGVLQGRATLRTNDAPPTHLEAGDVAVLNGRSWMELQGGAGNGPVREVAPPQGYEQHLDADGPDTGSDIVIGGHVDLDDTGRALLAESLPNLGHLRGTQPQAQNMRRGLRVLLEESSGGSAGSSFALRQHSRLLLLEVLRTYAQEAELPAGWLRALADDQLRPALAAIHSDPSRRWTLDDLARSARMSRTSFTERFRATAGLPPHSYLTRFRMLLARRALKHDDVPVGALAARLGYGSESSFSNAFKREVGESPLSYRTSANRSTSEMAAIPRSN
jgi:AraC-like DNA-binding protein